MDEKKLVLACTYDGSNTNKSGITTLKFVFPASELAKYINVVMLLNNDIKTQADNGEGTKGIIGKTRFKTLRINREGDAILQLESMDVNFELLNECFEKNIRLCLVAK